MISGILSGLQLVEVSAFVAGPLAGTTLANLGAEVIRIEQLGGGIDAHRWPLHEGRSLYREGLDQGKLSVALDLRSPAGRGLATDLVVQAGIVITNLGARGWFAYERLAEARPDLIMVVITGTPDGRAAVDYTVNAAIGFPLLTGPESDARPVNHVLPAWDVATGLLAATSVLAAERHRTLTGEGQLVRLALSDVALSIAGYLGYLAEARLVDEERARAGNYIYGTYGRDFVSADGRRLMICALTPRQWSALGEATGLEKEFKALETRHTIDLADEGQRFLHRAEISALLEPWVQKRTLAEIQAAFDTGEVLWAPYRTFKEAVAEEPGPDAASPLEFSSFGRPPAPASPMIGMDTERVLAAKLGLDAVAIAELRGRGVIQ